MALICDSTSYSLVINSADKISGTNNNATYQINWRDFLPDDFDNYKMAFSFQTIGGYYSDGIFSSIGLSGAANSAQTVGVTAIGATLIYVGQSAYFTVGNAVFCSAGIPQGATVVAVGTAPNTITISVATTAIIPNNTAIYNYIATAVSAVTFSSARVILQNQGRSYSFDTQTKGPSSTVGILQRDIQLSASKSNSLSCFYCQNAPRTIARPNQNLMTINIMNSFSFAGGIISYTNGVPTFSSVSTNQNFMTDTNVNGTTLATDMTGYTMLLEFIPIGKSKSDRRDGI